MNLISLFSDYVRNIAYFMIFMAFVAVVAPRSKHKDYINLMLGLVLIFLVISPLRKLTGGFEGLMQDTVGQLENKLGINVMAKEYEYYTEKNKEIVIDEYKARLTGQLENKLNADPDFDFISADFSIDTNEDNFGAIQNINLVVAEKAQSGQKKPFVRIESVTVDSVSAFAPKKSDDGPAEDERTERLKNSLSDFYNVASSNINITVQER